MAFLPVYGDATAAAFIGASALAIGTLFATHGIDRVRSQRAQLELQFSINTVVGEELISNRMRLETLANVGLKDKEGIPLFTLLGPLWLRGGDLVRTHFTGLEWKTEFLARVLSLYHNLEEAEGLRSLYAQSLALGGPVATLQSLAGRLQTFSPELLEEMTPVEESFKRQDFYRPDSILALLREKKPKRMPLR